MSFRIKIWGSRGSLPSPLSPEAVVRKTQFGIEQFLEQGFSTKEDIRVFLQKNSLTNLGGYGGNTPCVQVKSQKTSFAIDGGSGLRLLGYELMSGPCGKGQGEAHVFFTHFHWDHLIGIPFFIPIFIPGNHVHFYAVQDDLPDVFRTLFKKPYFPVPLESLGAKIHFHKLAPRKPHSIGDIQVTPYALDHPDPCWGYRIENGGKVMAHCVDTECKRVSRDELGPDLPLYQGVDLMLFDAQYTLLETLEKIDWGHAAASLGLDIAMREKVKRVLFMHHDPASTDEKIARAELEARRYYESQLKSAKRTGADVSEVEWSFAHDGLDVEV